MGALERSCAEEVQIFLCANLRGQPTAIAYGLGAPALASMADLFSLSIRLTSASEGRSAMRAMSSGNSYHLRPHCTRRCAYAVTTGREAPPCVPRRAGRRGAE